MDTRQQMLFLATKRFAPFAFALTAMAGTLYAVAQQDIRQAANDPQIQLAEDAAAALSDGALPGDLISMDQIDIATSLAPFVAAYTNTGAPIVSSGTLDGKIPTIPGGVFAYARAHGEHRLTWQPRPDVRQAIVVVPYNEPGGASGFVVAGRSLREAEARESRIGLLTQMGWASGMIAAFLAVLLLP